MTEFHHLEDIAGSPPALPDGAYGSSRSRSPGLTHMALGHKKNVSEPSAPLRCPGVPRRISPLGYDEQRGDAAAISSQLVRDGGSDTDNVKGPSLAESRRAGTLLILRGHARRGLWD